MGRAPVGGDEPGEPELLAQHRGQQVRVLAGGGAVDVAVGAHDRGRGALLDRVLEGRQVDLLLRLGADDGVVGRGVPVGLLVVDREVLDLGHRPGRLDALDLGRAERAVEVRVFADRLEGAAPARVADDVDRRAEVDRAALGRLLGPDHLAVELLGGGVPGGGRVDRRGELGDVRHPVADAGRAVLEVQGRDAERPDGGGEPDVAGSAGAGDQVDLLRLGDLGHHLGDPRRDRGARPDPRARGGDGGGGLGAGGGHRQQRRRRRCQRQCDDQRSFSRHNSSGL